jgi:glycine cleavage system H protein
MKFTKDHEWIRVDGDIGTVGITEYAQEQLGDVVYVDLPDVGRSVEQNGECAVVESVKAASEIYAPVSGEVVEVNEALNDNPGMVNEDATGGGWFLKIKLSDTSQLEKLMDEDGYKELLAELE